MERAVKTSSIFLVGLALCGLSTLLVGCEKSKGAGPITSPPEAIDSSIRLESLPIDVMSLDYASLVVSGQALGEDWLPIQDFGLISGVSDARPNPQPNPQPTFYAPLGTAVVAIVSGKVSSTSRLYSGDTSVMIAAHDGGVWEMEHVIKVRVRVGDIVRAGDTIAEVSNFECVARNNLPSDPICASGLGLVEIGLLYGVPTTEHHCPFDPLLVAASKRTLVFSQLDSARARIKAAFGDSTLYNKATWETPQCVTLNRVPG